MSECVSSLMGARARSIADPRRRCPRCSDTSHGTGVVVALARRRGAGPPAHRPLIPRVTPLLLQDKSDLLLGGERGARAWIVMDACMTVQSPGPKTGASATSLLAATRGAAP